MSNQQQKGYPMPEYRKCEVCGDSTGRPAAPGRRLCHTCKTTHAGRKPAAGAAAQPQKSFEQRYTEQRSAQRVTDELRALTEEVTSLRALQAAVRSLTDLVGKAPRILKPSKKVAGKRDGTLLVVASDWHVEEIVEPGKVAGRNQYDPEIAKKRAVRFFEAAAWALRNVRHSHTVDTMILALLGDFITGYLHPDNVESNDLSPIEAIQLTYSILRDGIDYLLEICELKQLIIPVCDGNHGRLTEKMRAAARTENSIEQLLYYFLASHYKNDARVRFVAEAGALTHLEVYGRLIRFMHGDTVRYHGGVGGITIPIYKALHRLDTLRKADLTVMGHFHQMTFARRVIINGSLIGYSPYAMSISAEYEQPQQACVLLDSEHFDAIKIPLWVASSKELYR